MVRTYELAAASFAFGDHRTAVPANRRQDVDHTGAVTHHDKRLAEQRNRIEVAGVAYLVNAADA